MLFVCIGSLSCGHSTRQQALLPTACLSFYQCVRPLNPIYNSSSSLWCVAISTMPVIVAATLFYFIDLQVLAGHAFGIHVCDGKVDGLVVLISLLTLYCIAIPETLHQSWTKFNFCDERLCLRALTCTSRKMGEFPMPFVVCRASQRGS